MKKKILAVLFLFIIIWHSAAISAEEYNCVEIFDPKQNKVVKVVELNAKIHNMVSSWIKDVDGIYGKSNPLTNDGYAIRVPLYPAVKVQGKWLNAIVNDVYIIIPQHDAPFYMIFDNDDKLLCFPFNGNINDLSKVLDFKLKSG